jgi:hypothetical protein
MQALAWAIFAILGGIERRYFRVVIFAACSCHALVTRCHALVTHMSRVTVERVMVRLWGDRSVLLEKMGRTRRIARLMHAFVGNFQTALHNK